MAEGLPQDTVWQIAYRAFVTMVAGDDAVIDLAQAALLISCIEYPDLDMQPYLAQLDALARRVRALLALAPPDSQPLLPSEIAPLTVLHAMNQVLFAEEQFRGNQDDYENPDNSYLNKVLEKHTGLPITLALLYMEVGKRVGMPIYGIGLPFHFMAGCPGPEGMIYIDAFHEGRLLNQQECKEYLRQMLKQRIKFYLQWFKPVSPKQFLMRLLNNLKRAYLEKEQYEHTLAVCDLLLALTPQAATELRDRGIIHLQLKHYARALHDLIAYVDLAPNAEDRHEMQGHIKTIRQMIAMMN